MPFNTPRIQTAEVRVTACSFFTEAVKAILVIGAILLQFVIVSAVVSTLVKPSPSSHDTTIPSSRSN
jgi:hypothetical protein